MLRRGAASALATAPTRPQPSPLQIDDSQEKVPLTRDDNSQSDGGIAVAMASNPDSLTSVEVALPKGGLGVDEAAKGKKGRPPAGNNTMFLSLIFCAGIILTSIVTALITKSHLQRNHGIGNGQMISTAPALGGGGVTMTADGRFNRRGVCSFKLAKQQSFGFFDDIPNLSWKLMQQRVKDSMNHLFPENPMKDSWLAWRWYQDNWEPDFSCQHERRVGGTGMGDGPKWVCNPHRIVETAAERLRKGHDKCLIYSIGSNGDFQFEEGLHALLGTELCEIHVFDPKDYASEVPEDISEMVHYHSWGIINDSDASSENFKTIKESVAMLGHDNRVIDIFKIDCEGCEWSTYESWFTSGLDIRQILVEVHNVPETANEFFEALQDHGYVTFHKEPNTKYSGGMCQEYAFIKLHPSFFV